MSQGKKSPVLVDYKKNDYRGFLFVVHEEYGLMLLRCTRKKNKPPHWQLPGGHIDEEEFLRAGMYVCLYEQYVCTRLGLILVSPEQPQVLSLLKLLPGSF